GAVRYSRQKDVAQNEEPSNGYTLVDAHLAYRWDRNASNSAASSNTAPAPRCPDSPSQVSASSRAPSASIAVDST
ncbi:hypothetical protein, partial [Stenotrophomonas sp. 3diitr2024]|uniref:hypothetical protein n=1 Tax=Stenotrophomonas sp. 3diitr2024 TaxID=3345115 RepID=UPI0035CA7E69